MPWLIPVATAAVGIGTSLYGANKQSQDNRAAQEQNAALQREQNAQAWANYLMTRGVNPAGTETGQIPTNPQAINARLPLWATANFARPSAQRRWVKKGTVPAAGTLARQGSTPAPVASSTPAASTESVLSGLSRMF